MKRMRSNDFVIHRPTKKQRVKKNKWSEEEFEKEVERRVKLRMMDLGKDTFDGYDYIS